MPDSNDPSSQAIKIIDRRRFTPQGEVRAGADLRPTAPAMPPPAPAAPRAPAPAPARSAAQPDDKEPPLRIELMPFVASLASNALGALGVLPEGQGGGMPPNPNVAREYIDIIVMLERKTRGNVTAEESQTLTQMVADLRLHYVEATRSVQPVR